MATNCGDVLSLEDLQIAKKNQVFEAEVITGLQGGKAGGANIEYATNQNTGQSQKTLPAVLRDAGFQPASFDFTTGGTLGVNDRNKVVYDPVSKTWYSWSGVLPHVIAAATNPVGVADWIPQTDPNLRADLASSEINKGASLISLQSGSTVEQAIEDINAQLSDNRILSGVSLFSSISGQSNGDTVRLVGFHLNSTSGGGLFRWDSSVQKSNHNGGTVIDPGKIFPSSWDAAGKNSWFTPSGSGSGCWIRTDSKNLLAEWFGAIPWVIGGTQDSTIEFQQLANVAGRGGTWRWTGRHRTTSFVLIPEKQTFGSFGQMTSVSVELFDPSNFQGVHTSPFASVADKVESALFYDSNTGEAFRCMSGAVPDSFLIYGKGYSTLGLNISTVLPHVADYYSTSAFRHGKYIRPRNVSVLLFKYAFDSNPWDTGGSYVGDYYSSFKDCEVTWCNCIRRVATTASYNTKFYNLRASVNRIGDFGVGVINMAFIGGSIESFNEPTSIREQSNINLSDSIYMETFDPAFNGKVFDVIGWCSFKIDAAKIYLNNVSEFISSGGSGQSTAVGTISLTGSGNVWMRSGAGSCSVYSIGGVPNKSIGLFGDIINQRSGATVSYYAGALPTDKVYVAPVVMNIP